jgi:hypothetical protein
VDVVNVLLQSLISVMICLSQVDSKQADHIQEHHHFSVKAAEYDVRLV